MAASICKERILRFLCMLLRTRRKPYLTAFLQPSSRIVNRIRLLRKRPTLKKQNKTAILAFCDIAGKIYLSLTPSKSDGRVPSQQGAPTSYMKLGVV